MVEFRYDVGALKPAKRLDGGGLVADALITKPGIFEYIDPKYPGGIRRELRPDDEVYSRETMDSFASMPVTPRHPPKLLNAKTAKTFMVGTTGDKVSRVSVAGEPDWVKTSIVIHDANTIERMDKGDDATSVGYACVVEMKSGNDPKYGRYDCIQRQIRGNHLAVAIPEGRAGMLARVRMDEAGFTSAVERFDQQNGKLTTEQKGHQHLVDLIDWDNKPLTYGTTSYALSPGASESHTHPWQRNADGTITIGAAEGHDHGIIEQPASAPLGTGMRSDGKPAGANPVGRYDARLGGAMPDPIPTPNMDAKQLEIALRTSEQRAAEQQSRADSAITERDQANGRILQLEKDVTALRSQIAAGATAAETAAIVEQRERADAAEARVARFDAEVTSRVQARTALLFRAGSVMGPEFRMDDMTDDQIRRAVVQRLDSTADVSNRIPEGVIIGQFEQLLKGALARARQDARVSLALGNNGDQNRNDEASQRMKDYQNQAYKPLSELFGRGKKGA